MIRLAFGGQPQMETQSLDGVKYLLYKRINLVFGSTNIQFDEICSKIDHQALSYVKVFNEPHPLLP